MCILCIGPSVSYSKEIFLMSLSIYNMNTVNLNGADYTFVHLSFCIMSSSMWCDLLPVAGGDGGRGEGDCPRRRKHSLRDAAATCRLLQSLWCRHHVGSGLREGARSWHHDGQAKEKERGHYQHIRWYCCPLEDRQFMPDVSRGLREQQVLWKSANWTKHTQSSSVSLFFFLLHKSLLGNL